MKWTIGKKIVHIFALAIVIIVVIGAANHSSSRKLGELTVRRQTSCELELATERLFSSLKDAESGQRGYIITGSDRYLDPYKAGVKDAQGFAEALRKLSEDDPERQRRLDQATKLMESKFSEMAKTIELRRREGLDTAAKEVGEDFGKKDMDELRQIIGDMAAAEHQQTALLAAEVEKSMGAANATVVFGTLIAVVVLMVAAWLLAKNISRPLAEMTEASKRIAAGDLSARLGADLRTDEVGVLRTAFEQMIRTLGEMAGVARRIAAGDLTAEIRAQSDRDELGTAFASMQHHLRELMRQTHGAVDVLSTSASEINASVTQVAAGASETAAAISQTTATVEEVKHAAQLNSDKVRQVSENAQRAAQTSEDGRRSVHGAAAGMQRIREQMDAISASMLRLSEQTLAIGEIIATVNDLAEQSNILAVNASIEAAKAGDQGKGFGVVAQEVRSLAEQSKQATTQVRSMLSEIQKAASAATLATEQGSKAVRAGLEQSEQAGHSISALSESISKSAQAAMQIAASSQQQAVGMDQVAIAIHNIHTASVQNAAAVKQVQDSARDLSELGTRLKSLIDRYKS